MNKKRFITGILILVGCIAVGVPIVISTYRDGPGESSLMKAIFSGVLLLLAPFILIGLALSVGELARSIVRRLKTAREREKAKRDRQRQARQNKPGSASQ